MGEALTDTTLCLFQRGVAGNVEPDNYCWADAAWHIWYADEPSEMTQACDRHLGPALAWRPVKKFHQFSSACNLPWSWWVPELGNCVTEELGLDLGFLERG